MPVGVHGDLYGVMPHLLLDGQYAGDSHGHSYAPWQAYNAPWHRSLAIVLHSRGGKELSLFRQ